MKILPVPRSKQNLFIARQFRQIAHRSRRSTAGLSLL